MIFIGKIYKGRITDRPRSAPPLLTALLVIGVVMQLVLGSLRPPLTATPEDLPPPSPPVLMQLAALGDRVAWSRLLMLWIQNFDNQPGLAIPFRHLDYTRLAGWLETILALDPQSEYPLFVALYLYAGIPDPQRMRIMLDFIHRQFLLDPAKRWRWLAFAAVNARHRLNDTPLALKYLDELALRVEQGKLPQWVLGVRLSILHATGQLESARQLIGGLLYHREVVAPTEIKFLSDWLEKLEADGK
ncbi:MAG: hypothetical protein HW380_3155 [Magnetococcales bacterium]|nr:hypothetical protein [Magnetococcales bacterium]